MTDLLTVWFCTFVPNETIYRTRIQSILWNSVKIIYRKSNDQANNKLRPIMLQYCYSTFTNTVVNMSFVVTDVSEDKHNEE